jgi:hypothetical protein
MPFIVEKYGDGEKQYGDFGWSCTLTLNRAVTAVNVHDFFIHF